METLVAKMKPSISPKVSTVAPSRVALKPELLWPSICSSGLDSNDMRQVPSETQILNKHTQWAQSEKLFESIEFWRSAEAAEEIRIIDPHLDIHAMRSIRELLGLATGIKILRIMISANSLSEQIESTFEDLRVMLNELGCKGELELKQSLENGMYPYLHDRFALIDGELWHFGATVGGLHHSLNALSRGWDDTQHKFKDFFDNVWIRHR
jgi:hypothetical protein